MGASIKGESAPGPQAGHRLPGEGWRSRLVPTLPVLCTEAFPVLMAQAPATPSCSSGSWMLSARPVRGLLGPGLDPGAQVIINLPCPSPPGEAAPGRSYRCRPTLGKFPPTLSPGSSPITWESSAWLGVKTVPGTDPHTWLLFDKHLSGRASRAALGAWPAFLSQQAGYGALRSAHKSPKGTWGPQRSWAYPRVRSTLLPTNKGRLSFPKDLM